VVTIELFGVARMRAGCAALSVEARCLGDALRALGERCPSLVPAVVADGRLGRGYLVALNGAQLTADPEVPLADGDVVVLVSADAGG
jgi:molybdopterin converting factor small subunit